jgi:hypothetical protein
MSRLTWGQPSDRLYETGVKQAVLYKQNGAGAYTNGYAWNGMTAVTESPSGAESTKLYADDSVYLNLLSVEEFGCTIEAYTYPDEFAECDGSAEPSAGVSIGQQTRKPFGFCYRTRIGNAITEDLGYKLHIVYGALAAPSEKAYATVNDSPEAITFSWEVSTTPVAVTGRKPTASLVIDSTKVDPTTLAALEDILYGTTGTDPSLPMPDDIIAMFEGTLTLVTPTVPSYNGTTHVITIPTVTGVTYYIDDEIVTGTVTLTTGQNKLVIARANIGYYFPDPIDSDWLYTY